MVQTELCLDQHNDDHNVICTKQKKGNIIITLPGIAAYFMG